MRGIKIPAATRHLVAARSRGRCEAAIRGICCYWATEIHHVKSRARGGSNSIGNLLNLCHECHGAITKHRPGTEIYRTHSWQSEGRHEDTMEAVNEGSKSEGCRSIPDFRGKN